MLSNPCRGLVHYFTQVNWACGRRTFCSHFPGGPTDSKQHLLGSLNGPLLPAHCVRGRCQPAAPLLWPCFAASVGCTRLDDSRSSPTTLCFQLMLGPLNWTTSVCHRGPREACELDLARMCRTLEDQSRPWWQIGQRQSLGGAATKCSFSYVANTHIWSPRRNS
jgi:hypothetical protein